MIVISAAQHIFTSVSAEQSPNRRRGYQTLFCTTGLPLDVIKAIENRALYYTLPGDPIKYQFYPLPGGKFAISNIVPVKELDEFGRSGRYLAHTLIIDYRSFQLLDFCPLDLFNQIQFATHLDPIYAEGNMKDGSIPSTQFQVTSQWQDEARAVFMNSSRGMLISLGRLTWQAQSLADQGEYVTVVGDRVNQLRMLALLYYLCAPPKRVLLSFDTHATGCNWGKRIYFWLSGYITAGQDSSRASAHFIDLENTTLESKLKSNNDGPCACWVVDYIGRGTFQRVEEDAKQNFQTQLQSASLLEQALEGKPPGRDMVPFDFLERFSRLNSNTIARVWLTSLPTGLSTELYDFLARPVIDSPMTYLDVLCDGIQPADINWFMFEMLLQLEQLPLKSDRSQLEKWIRTTTDITLLSLIPLWNSDDRDWNKSLHKVAADDYVYILTKLTRWKQLPLSLRHALVQPYTSLWVRTVATFLPADEWKKSLTTVEKFPETTREDSLQELAKLVHSLSPTALKEIESWLRDYRGQATDLRTNIARLLPENRRSRWI